MKKIIFKKELFIKNVGVEHYNNTNGWVEFLDGKKIDCYAIYMDGFPLPFKIKPEWCQEFDDLDSEDEETVMTISEIEKKLGIENLKIKKED